MKKLLIMAATAALAIALVLVMRPKRVQEVSEVNEIETVVSESGTAAVKSPEVKLQERKKYYADLVSSASEWSDDKWLKSFELTERSGRKVSSQELLGKPYVASFFFSKCPSVCVQQNDRMKLLQQKFRGADIRFLSISCDPENDTPEALTEYAKRFAADQEQWLFLTGEWDYTKRVSAEVFFNALHTPKFHIEKFLLMGSDGKIIADYDWHEPEELELLEKDIQSLLSKDVSK